jgi:hypothetical protein
MVSPAANSGKSFFATNSSCTNLIKDSMFMVF